MQPARLNCLWLLGLAIWLPAAFARPVNVGVLAHRGVDTAIEMWGPTIDYLAEHVSGQEFRLLPLDLQGMHDALEHSELDFILTKLVLVRADAADPVQHIIQHPRSSGEWPSLRRRLQSASVQRWRAAICSVKAAT